MPDIRWLLDAKFGTFNEPKAREHELKALSRVDPSFGFSIKSEEMPAPAVDPEQAAQDFFESTSSPGTGEVDLAVPSDHEETGDGFDEAVCSGKPEDASSKGTGVNLSGSSVTPPSSPAIVRQKRPELKVKISFCVVAISVFMKGHTFPSWCIAARSEGTLKSLLRRWAHEHLGIDSASPLPEGIHARAGENGPEVELGDTLISLRPRLPVVDGRLSISVTWPASAASVNNGLTTRTKGSGELGRLRISTRYANVDGVVAGYHSSSTFLEKQKQGLYQETEGMFKQAPLIQAMRTPPEPPLEELVIVSRELAVFPDDDSHVRISSSKPLFKAMLRGPEAHVVNWELTCEKFKKSSGAHDKEMPYPVFIPSRGRAWRANLNWEAEHVFGKVSSLTVQKEVFPVICIVVEPAEEEDYRDAWPMALTLVLPEDNRGPGYVRYVVQKVCSKAYQRLEADQRGPRGKRWAARRLPRVWIADDGLSMFYSLHKLLPDVNSKTTALDLLSAPGQGQGCVRLKEREAAPGSPMFREALLVVQQHAFLPNVAVAGFLRDDGTAVCKKRDWKTDELSMYKIVLLNLIELKRLGVEYQRDLQMYEDISLTHQVLRFGGRTLKCLCYCFRASHSSKGGCANQRDKVHESSGTQLEDLVSREAFNAMGLRQQESIQELLNWVRSKERWSAEKEKRASAEKDDLSELDEPLSFGSADSHRFSETAKLAESRAIVGKVTPRRPDPVPLCPLASHNGKPVEIDVVDQQVNTDKTPCRTEDQKMARDHRKEWLIVKAAKARKRLEAEALALSAASNGTANIG
eukprot:TRINITY_DN35252_c1_g1_i1.p1 TRINITY_DN35252_c1_g1~~TRINITY_DN35252_c1_g1_i1.p1  ORF type:complete len:882 (+),score=153.29 TRINITY_DN35252_c1_g1_i1:234-2648(+)